MIRHCMARIQVVSAKRKQLEEEMKLILSQRNTVLPQGETEQLNLLNAEIFKRRENHQKLTQILAALHQHLLRLSSQSQGAANAQRQDDSQPPQPNSSVPSAQADASSSVLPVKDPQTPFNPATTPRQPSTVQSPIINPHVVRSINSGLPTSSPNLNALNIPVAPMVTNSLSGASALNTQMQKLLQVDRSRLPVGVTSNTGLPVMSTESTVTAADPTFQPLQQQLQPSNLNQIMSVLVWEGTLSFNGTGSDGNKKEVHTRVSASSSNASNRWDSSSFVCFTSVLILAPAIQRHGQRPWLCGQRKLQQFLCLISKIGYEERSLFCVHLKRKHLKTKQPIIC